MWTLECDGPILENKRIWLRPGKCYLFGRTTPPKGRLGGFVVDEKSVSRQHLTLSVSRVKPGDGSHVHARSEVTLEEMGAKFGTDVDGERISGTTKILKNNEHTFVLGKTKHLFRIKWQPVVLSFSVSSKEIKGGKDPLIPIRSRLEDLDIKAILPYIIGTTTHVVCSKRNTAKGLQALINGKYIVTESFIDALTFATTPGDLDEPESLCSLEWDYDGNWPNALDHLPAKSKEPNERPKEFFRPNPERINIFEGYTFVFCDQIQFETLQAPVLNGGGKALHFQLEMGQTSPEELVRYVKNAAGEKSLGEFEDGSEGKGLVVVRFRGKQEFEEWAVTLCDQVALALNQRMIEQSEFMDAILENSASKLRSPLQEEDEQDLAARPVPERNNLEQERSAEPETAQRPERRGRFRGTIKPRFKGFDDGSDENDTTPPPSHRAANGTQSHKLSSVRQLRQNRASSSDAEMHSEGSNTSASRAPRSRKRSALPSEEENEEAFVDRILPAATAMKRRKMEEQEKARRSGVSTETSVSKSQPESAPAKEKKPRKEINIQEVVRERREAEEDAARRDEESLRENPDGMEVEKMRNLAVIEEMSIPDRCNRPQRNQGEGGRWDDSWNGRKNFKKFRRKGDGTLARRGQSVMVPLEEVKKKDYGIGEDYWLDSDKLKTKRKTKDRPTQETPIQPTYEREDDDGPVGSSLTGNSNAAHMDVDAPRMVRRSQQQHPVSQAGDSGLVRSQAPHQGKRAAASGGTEAPPAKKQRLFEVAEESGSDSEDELKFSFKKRI